MPFAAAEVGWVLPRRLRGRAKPGGHAAAALIPPLPRAQKCCYESNWADWKMQTAKGNVNSPQGFLRETTPPLLGFEACSALPTTAPLLSPSSYFC